MNLAEISRLEDDVAKRMTARTRERRASLMRMADLIETPIKGVTFLQIDGKFFGDRKEAPDGHVTVWGCAAGKLMYALGVRHQDEITRQLPGIMAEDIELVIALNDKNALPFSAIARTLREMSYTSR